jgi:hypothetical protein
MANVIKHKRSTTPGAAPASNQLVEGELAVNVADGVLFVKNSAAAIVGFPNLPLTARPGELLAWDGTQWVATSIWALLNTDAGGADDTDNFVLDGGDATSTNSGVIDGNLI